jgi:hypothetical protein
VSFSVVMENTYQVFNIIVHAFYKLLKFFHCAFTVKDNRSFDLYEAKSEKTKILYKGRFFSWVPLVEQELLNLLEHLISAPVFSEVCVTRSLVLCVCFVDRCLPFCTFSFGHCVVCSSSIYRFWLPLRYLQTLLTVYQCHKWLNMFFMWL